MSNPSENVKVVITPPGPQAPGFARRIRRAAYFQDAVSGGKITATLIDELVLFLADYCEGPREDVIEHLWGCSQDQFMEILSAVAGGSGSEVPPVN